MLAAAITNLHFDSIYLVNQQFLECVVALLQDNEIILVCQVHEVLWDVGTQEMCCHSHVKDADVVDFNHVPHSHCSVIAKYE